MRAIKFRAWDKKDRVMRYVLNIEWHTDYPDRLRYVETYPLRHLEAERVELLQFTGLLDKTGKEIYEGDIVKVYSYHDEEDPELDEFTIHEIVWGGDYPAFELNPTIAEDCNSLQSSINGDCGEAVLVIGNIHSNPELLQPTSGGAR